MSKFKKTLSFIMAVALTVATFSLTGCGGHRGEGDVEVNTSQTQLYIGNYGGGFGTRWLDEYIKLFEEKYKDVEYEPGSGKKGVQVIPVTDQDTYSGKQIKNTMKNSTINVYFSEIVDYYDLVSEGLLYDISDVADSVCEGETRKISDKLTEEQKLHLTRAKKDANGNYDGKYYALPSYQAFRGITYDVDLFDQKKLYFSDEGMIECSLSSTNRSAGPDGVKGTYDDGLPATYNQFFELCDYIKDDLSYIPICWTGAYKESYTEHLLDALYADAQGKDEYNIRYDLGTNGTKETDMITGFDGSGNPVIEKKAINVDPSSLEKENNYTEISKQKGLYYSLDFLAKLVNNGYADPTSYAGAYTQTLTHYKYLHSRFGTDKPIAMMLEGTWWEEEANDTFEGMENVGAGRYQRRLGFLPLPKAPGVEAGPQTLFNGNNSYVMVNGNCNENIARAAKDFIRFISSDEMLNLFTKYTGICKDYNYEVKPEILDNLSYYAKSVYEVRKNADIVYANDMSIDTYKWRKFNEIDVFDTNIDGVRYSFPVDAFKDYNVDAKDYFNGLYAKNR